MINTKSSRIEIRTNEETKKLIEKAASLNGETISSYIISKSLSSAKEDIAQMETIIISDKDRDLFYSLLTNPPKPNKALEDLFNKSL